MDLFDKLNDFTKDIADKASSAVGIGRLTVNIKAEEMKIDSLQKQIGQYYYERHVRGEKFDPETELYLAKIDEVNKTIAVLQAEMKVTKTGSSSSGESAVRFCSNCGAKLQPGSNFCNYCGTKQF